MSRRRCAAEPTGAFTPMVPGMGASQITSRIDDPNGRAVLHILPWAKHLQFLPKGTVGLLSTDGDGFAVRRASLPTLAQEFVAATNKACAANQWSRWVPTAAHVGGRDGVDGMLTAMGALNVTGGEMSPVYVAVKPRREGPGVVRAAFYLPVVVGNHPQRGPLLALVTVCYYRDVSPMVYVLPVPFSLAFSNCLNGTEMRDTARKRSSIYRRLVCAIADDGTLEDSVMEMTVLAYLVCEPATESIGMPDLAATARKIAQQSAREDGWLGCATLGSAMAASLRVNDTPEWMLPVVDACLTAAAAREDPAAPSPQTEVRSLPRPRHVPSVCLTSPRAGDGAPPAKMPHLDDNSQDFQVSMAGTVAVPATAATCVALPSTGGAGISINSLGAMPSALPAPTPAVAPAAAQAAAPAAAPAAAQAAVGMAPAPTNMDLELDALLNGPSSPLKTPVLDVGGLLMGLVNPQAASSMALRIVNAYTDGGSASKSLTELQRERQRMEDALAKLDREICVRAGADNAQPRCF